MQIINLTRDNKVLADKTAVARSFFRRLKGLLGAGQLPQGSALIIRPCSSVHTFGMQYPIDVVFVNDQNIVVKTVEALFPGRIAWSTGSYAVELPAGTVQRTGTLAGDRLSIVE